MARCFFTFTVGLSCSVQPQHVGPRRATLRLGETCRSSAPTIFTPLNTHFRQQSSMSSVHIGGYVSADMRLHILQWVVPLRGPLWLWR
jgi:hypothetical protein